MLTRFPSASRLRPAALLPLLALAGLASTLRAQVTDPKITEWVTARSYARVYTTAANRTSGTSATTWSGATSPFYSDIQRVVYSNAFVYLYATGMPSYVAGNWLNPNGQQYASWPKNRAAIHRIPRTVTIPGTKQKTNGSGGVLLNGVFVWANGDGQSYDNVGTALTATTATISMAGDGIWNRLAGVAEDFNFDPAKGHHPSNGAYHNHVNPIGLRYQLGDHVSYNSSTKAYAEAAGAPSAHSPLIGFANDGLPIYGPYGYATATDAASGVRRMTTGFVKRNGSTTNLSTGQPNTNLAATGRTTLPVWAASVQGKSIALASTEYGPNTTATYANGPTTNPCSIGIFAEDYDYLGDLGYTQGTHFDLNRQNVRYCVTPEYPAGTYAYFVSIDASGVTAFPDIINQEFFGTAAMGQGTVTSITEAVTEYVKGGQASPLTLSAAAASPSGVTLTWPSVEGATYTAASSADGVSYTTLSSSLAGTRGGVATYTTATVAPHYKITLTTLAAYDSTGNGGVSGLNTFATATYTGAGVNQSPTLTTVSTLSGATEDSAFTLDYATLADAADEADPDGDALAFRIESVSSGTLTKGGSAVVPGVTLLSTGESLVWTPAPDASGTLAAFTVVVTDGAAVSATAVPVNIAVAAANDAPTLATVSTLTGAVKNSAFPLAYATLAAAADEADPDGDALSFLIESVSSGTLAKDGSAVVPGATTLATGESLVWTPASDATGTLAAFTVRASDGAALSPAAVVVNIAVTAAPVVVADPLLTGWFTARSGKYARLYQTAAAETAGTTSTTWSRGQGTQSLPVYSDISEVNSSANWVYVRTSNLPSHVMGPWYLDAAKTQLFPNYPANRAEVYRFPRSPVIPATKAATAGGSTGKAVNGVSLFDGRDTYSYITATGADAAVGGPTPGDGIWNRDAYFNESVTFDPAFAHQAGAQYHYHAQPIALRHQLGDNVAYNAATNRYSENPAAATAHSPILGWANDGLPVYGPYGYSVATDPDSGIRRMISGYTLRDGSNGSTAISVRQILPAWARRFQNRATLTPAQYGPAVNATYALGRYIEDFEYRGDLGQTQGVDFDLNEYNVRWCVTPEFPAGTYAYFTPIKADGTPMYPYTTGRQYFGTPSGGATTAATMNADTPLTRQATGGPNQALVIPATPTVSSGLVSVTWTAVEGATYAVAASTDNTAYTPKATGLVATGTTRAATYSALSTGGTEYTRVTRTALPNYDTNGFSPATVAQTATASFSTGPLNSAPTLDNVDNLSGATAGLAFSISYEAVAAVANEADAEGDTLAFRVESLGVGTLTKTDAPVAVGDLLSAGESFVWTPAADASGNLVPFTFVAWDGALASGPAVNLTVQVVAPPPLVAPEVTEDPGSDYVIHGDAYQFTVSATGTEPLTYQWYRDGAPLADSNSATYAIASALSGVHDGSYTVTVSNPAGSDTSEPATLRVIDNSPYGLWLTEAFTFEELIAGTITATSADPDGDGLANFAEYVFARDPRVAESGSPTAGSVIAGHLAITFPRRSENPDITHFYVVEVSADLVTWTSGEAVTAEVSVTPVPDSGQELVTVRDLSPLAAPGRRFIRLRFNDE